jgi:hypothetical protein
MTLDRATDLHIMPQDGAAPTISITNMIIIIFQEGTTRVPLTEVP